MRRLQRAIVPRACSICQLCNRRVLRVARAAYLSMIVEASVCDCRRRWTVVSSRPYLTQTFFLFLSRPRPPHSNLTRVRKRAANLHLKAANQPVHGGPCLHDGK